MTADERIKLLEKAREAGKMVEAEIESRNARDINPFRQRQREPALQRARAVISDCDRAIRDLQATQTAVVLSADVLARLNELEASLDSAIASNGFANLAVSVLARVVERAREVQTSLA